MDRDYIKLCAEMAYNDIIINSALNEDYNILNEDSSNLKNRLLNIVKIFKSFINNIFNKIIDFIFVKIKQLKQFILDYNSKIKNEATSEMIYYKDYINLDAYQKVYDKYNNIISNNITKLLRDYRSDRNEIEEADDSFNNSNLNTYKDKCDKIIERIKNRNKKIREEINREAINNFYLESIQDKSNLKLPNVIQNATKNIDDFYNTINYYKNLLKEENINIENKIKEIYDRGDENENGEAESESNSKILQAKNSYLVDTYTSETTDIKNIMSGLAVLLQILKPNTNVEKIKESRV